MDPMNPFDNMNNGGQMPPGGTMPSGTEGMGVTPPDMTGAQQPLPDVPTGMGGFYTSQPPQGPPPMWPGQPGMPGGPGERPRLGRRQGGTGNGGGSGGDNGSRDKGGKKSPLAALMAGASVALVVLMIAILVLTVGAVGAVRGLTRPASPNVSPPQDSFSVVYVVGSIQNTGSDVLGINEPSYRHSDTVQYIKSLADNPNDKGILLYMNTPGGGVYESDEVYLALMDYKKKTGRPVWAYMAQTCASGGYYICAAADYIVANRNTTTGSMGVYIALTDTSGLYEKLGIETVLVKSGENKGTGMSGVPITEGQRDVYQSVVDESFAQFVEIVADGRGMSEKSVLEVADGRVYTGRQALDLGLIDELGDWESCLKTFGEELAAGAFYPSFSRSTPLGRMLGGLLGALPVGDAEAALNAAEAQPSGVPMAMYCSDVWS